MGKRELVDLLILSSWCFVMVERLFLAVPRVCLRFVIVVFPDHTHYFCVKAQKTAPQQPFRKSFSKPRKKIDTFHDSVIARTSVIGA